MANTIIFERAAADIIWRNAFNDPRIYGAWEAAIRKNDESWIDDDEEVE